VNASLCGFAEAKQDGSRIGHSSFEYLSNGLAAIVFPIRVPAVFNEAVDIKAGARNPARVSAVCFGAIGFLSPLRLQHGRRHLGA
jgi:hypothetical protein